ncbi:MAG TPA: hypothetical protein VK775_03935 [Chthoniobacterales bacterium]|nr:hypothetical protein [Chthoniobacterales bacterium]
MVFHEGHGLYPIDAVHRTIEVKSTLKREHLQEAEEAALLLDPRNPDGLKIASPGALEDSRSFYPFSAIFAFDADWGISADSLPDGMKGESAPCGLVSVAKRNFCAWHGIDFKANSPAHAVRLFAFFILETIEASAASRSKFSLGVWLDI